MPLQPPRAVPAEFAVARRDPAARRDTLILVAATAALLLPFVHKPPHIDDHLFLVAAERIREAPLDFFGGFINWYGSEQPLYLVTQNPPGAAFLLALLLPLGSLAALHIGFAVVTIACILGVRTLASDVGAPPLAAGFLTLAMPVFLVSATTLMSDVPMTAIFVWAIVLWLRGLEAERRWLLMAASVAAGIAILTKYFAVTLVPLFVLAALMRNRRFSLWAPALIPAVVIVVAYEFLTRSLYGVGHFTEAFAYASRVGKAAPAVDRALLGLVFAGGCVVPVLACVPHFSRRPVALWAPIAATVAGLIAWRGLAAAPSPELVSHAEWLVWTAAFAGAGVVAACVVARALLADRSTATVTLAAWIVVTFGFAALGNWTTNGRSVLPLVPPLAILLALQLRAGLLIRTAAIAPGIVLSLIVAHGDLRLAGAGPAAAAIVRARADVSGSRIWFQGHWGLQTAMESIGARPIAFGKSPIRAGDFLLVPHQGTNLRALPEGWVRKTGEFEVPVQAFATTMSLPAGCGFYSTLWGPFPFLLSAPPPERFSTFVALVDFPAASPSIR